MAWKNYKRNYHRNRIARRYVRERFNWDNHVTAWDVLDYVDRDAYRYEYQFYSSYYGEILNRYGYDAHRALGDLPHESKWEIQKKMRDNQFIGAKKIADGGYSKYRRCGSNHMAKALFQSYRHYDRLISRFGKYWTEEEYDEIGNQDCTDAHLGWWD